MVRHRGGHLQVIACAGSGKTESISRRVAALIAEGAEPASIVAFTFTERAAAELKNRIGQRVAEAMGEEFLGRLGPMFVGTIHAYCFRLLQDHVPHFGNYDVLDEHRHAGLLSREYRNLGLSKLGARHWQPIRDFLQTVDVIGNELIEPDEIEGTPIGECYAAYREMLDRYHFLTFGLIISRAVEALEDPAIFKRVHGPLRHLLVDEYQDINPAQERLIQLLARKPVELCVVGDDDQSIYQWRGSDVGHIVTFTKRHKSATTVTLASNRRSRPNIVNTATAFAASITPRLPKDMKAVREPGKNEVVGWVAETEAEEAETIAGTIARLHERGYRYQDIGVLYRSVRTSAAPLIAALRERGIPYTCAGRTGLFMQPEVALLGETFAWLADSDWKDGRYEQSRPVDLDALVAGLDRCFGNVQPIPRLKKYLEDWKLFHSRSAHRVSLVGDLYRLLATLGVHTIDVDTPEGAARLGALARFSKILADYEHVNRRGRWIEEDGKRRYRGGRDRGKPYFQGLANYLLHYARDAYEEFEGEPAADLDAVDILTIHQAKGLEWPVVFVPALVTGRFPSRLCGTERDWQLPVSVFPGSKRARYQGSVEDERRLFYVAMTRAREAVYLSRFQKKVNRFKPSLFFEEVVGKSTTPRRPLPLPNGPAALAADQPPPLSVSYSDVALFDECAHRYRLASVFGYEQELAEELGYGKAIHHVLRHIAEHAQRTGSVPDKETIGRVVDEELYLPFANEAALTQMTRAANRLVTRYAKEFEDDLKRVWAIERPFVLHLPDGTVAGRADIILDESNGRIQSLTLVDYKVAHADDREERYHRQLAVYAAAGQGEGLNVDAAFLHDLSDGSRIAVHVGTDALRTAVEAVTASVGQIRRGVFRPNPEQTRCKACDHRLVCTHCPVGARE